MSQHDNGGNPEAEAAAREAFANALKKGKITEARKLSAELGIPKNEFLASAVREANMVDVIDLLEDLDEAEKKEFLALPETKEATRASMVRDLGKRAIDATLQAISLYELSPEDLANEELQAAAKVAIVETLKRGNAKGMGRIMKAMNISNDVLTADGAGLVAAKEGYKYLANGQSRPKELSDAFAEAMKEWFADDDITSTDDTTS